MILFLVMGIGYYAARAKIINEESTSHISNFIVTITLPLMILTSFNVKYSVNTIVIISQLLIFSIIAFFISMIIGKVISFKFNCDRKDILMFMSIFSNCGFIGFPVLKVIYGDKGVLYTSIFNLVYNVFIWTFGIVIMNGRKEKINYKKILLNHNILAVILGMVLMLSSIKIPYVINSAFNLVGSMTAPLSMIVIGSILTTVEFNDIFKDWSLYYISALRLVLIPMIIYFALKPFLINKIVIGVIIICEAMPGGTLCPILAKNYNRNFKYASKIVLVTTIVSMITIPIITLFLGI
ncbi:AEC family transporter [Clostridium felsineum]|nr:AEC family transporter [Clostridium felsineum]